MKWLTDCLSNSTSHGISNTFKHPTVSGKVVWAIFTAISFAVFATHTTLLVEEMNSEYVTTSVIPFATGFRQPDIVFCFYRIFAKDYLLYPPPTEFDFMYTLAQKIEEIGNKSLMYKSELFGQWFLWNSINLQDIYKAFFHRDYSLILNIECNGQAFIFDKFEFNFDYLSCIRIPAEKCVFKSKRSRINALFYMHSYRTAALNKPTSLNITYANMSFENFLLSSIEKYGRTDGTHVFFTESKEHPIRDQNVVLADGLKETDIKIESIEHDHIRRKDFQCRESRAYINYYNFLEDNITKNPLNFSEVTLCKERKIQMCLLRSLNCVLMNYPIPIRVPQPFRACLNISDRLLSMEEFKKFESVYFTCEQESEDDCATHRFCKYVKWNLKTNQMRWPNTDSLLHLLETIIPEMIKEDENRAKHFPGIKEALRDIEKNPDGLTHWKKNFIKVSIGASDMYSSKFTENLSYTAKNLLSDVGGIMGFYLGASVLTLCEVYNIIHGFLCQLFTRKKSPDENNTEDDMKMDA